MEIIPYRDDQFEPLFAFWNKLAARVPYFFPVSAQRWHECLLDDTLGRERLFLSQQIFIAREKDRIVGFSQCGQPAFAWDENGQTYPNPQIGVLRHFYFDEGQMEAAELLFAQSEGCLKRFPDQHAFYHIFGMSCNARHGKLYQGLAHVEQFLCQKGYWIDQENVYYSLELNGVEAPDQRELELIAQPILKAGAQNYAICLQGQPIGTIQIGSLRELTGSCTRDVVYLTWIGINREFRRQGWGTRALQLLAAELRGKQYRQLHLDTASTNEGAQRFYELFGFQNRGRTRSYRKTTSP